MMNKYHWSRPELEERFPIDSKVRYCGTTNPKLVGRNGVVTGYSQSGGIKVHFDDCSAITKPENLTAVPEENTNLKEIEERLPIGVKVRCTDTSRSPLCGYSGVVRGYSSSGDIEVSFGAWGTTIPPESLTVVSAASPPFVELQPEVTSDVAHPNHYTLFGNVKAIEIIARSMTVEAFSGFCLGNVLKYRLRAGKKSELATVEKDLNKASFYQELFDKYKGLCHDAT